MVGLVGLALLSTTFVLPAPSGGVPRVVGIPIGHAREQMRRWERDVGGWDLSTSQVMYSAAVTKPTHGAVALVHAEEITAIALLENRPSGVCVWSINCVDDSSGSTLLKAMCHVQKNLTMAHTVHPRWHVARSFYGA